jgi:hypothetical protein
MLWWTANLLASILAIAIAYFDGLLLSVLAWVTMVLILMVFRPQ